MLSYVENKMIKKYEVNVSLTYTSLSLWINIFTSISPKDVPMFGLKAIFDWVLMKNLLPRMHCSFDRLSIHAFSWPVCGQRDISRFAELLCHAQWSHKTTATLIPLLKGRNQSSTCLWLCELPEKFLFPHFLLSVARRKKNDV